MTHEIDDAAIDQEAGTGSVWELRGKVDALETENAKLRAELAEAGEALERSAEGFGSITKEAYPIAPSPEDWDRMVFVARTSERRAREALRKLKGEVARIDAALKGGEYE